MKRTVKSLGAVVVYLLLLCYLLKTDAVLIFSPRHIGMFLLGCIILCMPYFEKKTDWKKDRDIIKKNAIMAGYLETFMLMFVSMNGEQLRQGELLSDFALNLRPLFYGFVCHMIIGNEQPAEKTEPSGEKEEEAVLELSKLTRQEKQVAELVRKGLTNKEIGQELSISEATVKKHMSNIFEKLGISSRRELR